MNGEEQEQFAVGRLSELRNAMQNEECPPRVRGLVLGEFARERACARRTWRRPFVWSLAASAACALLAVAIMMRRPAGAPHPAPERVAKAIPPALSSVGPQTLERKESVPDTRVAASKPRVRSKRVPVRAEAAVASREASPQIVTDFLALPYAPPLYPDEGANVVRVRLPRSAMRSFGLPVSEDRLCERVPADVILGQDGIARAVRFVKVAQ